MAAIKMVSLRALRLRCPVLCLPPFARSLGSSRLFRFLETPFRRQYPWERVTLPASPGSALGRDSADSQLRAGRGQGGKDTTGRSFRLRGVVHLSNAAFAQSQRDEQRPSRSRRRACCMHSAGPAHKHAFSPVPAPTRRGQYDPIFRDTETVPEI